MQLLSHLPADTNMGFVLIQHLAPDQPSALVHLLSQTTVLPVHEATDKKRILPNHVYVIAPSTALRVTKGILRVQERAQTSGTQHSIDVLFESLAHDLGEHAIGIVLSGNASDGTQGLVTIKACGGLTFAQDDSAQYQSMPHSAIAAGCVDRVLSPVQIAEELIRIARHSYALPVPHLMNGEAPETTPSAPPLDALAEETITNGLDFQALLEFVRNHSKVDFALYKSATINRRIARRMTLHGIIAPEDYTRLLQRDSHEADRLYTDLLISVTGFFRDPDAFEALSRETFPALLDLAGGGQPRIWVAGCSTGQEAYSLAMAFAEFSERAGAARSPQIFATDLNEAQIDKARAGLYPDTIAQEMSPERLRRFFIAKEGGGYHVIKELRERIVFARHNLLSDPPFSRMDLITCRNLMIYLEPHVQRKVLANLHYALKPHGFLFLGSSESIGAGTDRFQALNKKYKIYTRRPGGSAPQLEPTVGPQNRKTREPATGVLVRRPERHSTLPELNVQREADRVTVKRFAPPGVLINADWQILQFRGSTSPYLGPPSHRASFQIGDMARDDLRRPLRAVINKAMKEDQAVRKECEDVILEVIPLKNLSERHYLILFEPLDAAKTERSEPLIADHGDSPSDSGKSRARAKMKTTRQFLRWEREIAEARDYAQALQEQYETANEELQTSNEEARSANEELQSTNEQLQTSKEEIDSANEELITVNAELAHSNAELSRLNDDFVNLQASVNLPIVVLSHDLRVRSFTARAAPLFSLATADVGQSINGIRHQLNCPDLGALAAEVIDTVSTKEREIQERAGHWYLLRMQPYMTTDRKVDGAVLVLLDIDAIKRSTLASRRALDYAEAMLRTARIPLLALHSDLRVNTANEAFYRTFKLAPEAVVGRELFSLDENAWDTQELRSLLLEILPRDGVINDFHMVHDFPGLGQRTMWLNAQRMPGPNGAVDMIVMSIEDVTEQLAARDGVRRSEVRFRRLFEAAQDGIIIIDPVSGKISDANPFIADFLGYQRTDFIGQRLEDVGLFPNAAACEEALTALAREDDVRYDNMRVQGRDGHGYIVEVAGHAYEESERPVFQFSIRDTTARARALDALRASEARFQAVADNVPVMIWMRDSNDQVTYFNRVWQAFVGGADDQSKDDHWRAAIHPEDRTRVLAEYARAFADQTRFESKYRLRQNGGDYRLILDVGAPLMNDGKLSGYVGSCLDITEREQIDSELLKSSKLESIGILAGGIAHDFNNLLTAIIGNIGLARLSLDPDGDLYKGLVAAEYAGLRARDLAQQLLIFAQGGAPIQNVLSLGGLLEEWISFAMRGSPVKTITAIASDLWPVEADSGQLSQVINNLIINAQQAMPQGGTIEVTAENVTLHIGSGLPFTGDYVRTTITDHGMGIAKNHLAKVFDPFFTTKPKGTGLGLATSYAIVKKHRGHLTVHSEIGQGATFCIYLPASHKAVPAAQGPQSLPSPGAGKILFMDDEPVIRRFASSALESFGYQVECVENGTQAIASYRLALAQGAPYLGVILDLTIPGGMGGRDTMRALLAIDPKVNAIVSSGYSNDPIMANFSAYGFCGRIAKPYQIDDLRRTAAMFSKPSKGE